MDFESIAEEAREEFNLLARLMQAPRLGETIKLVTDEPLAKQIGGVREEPVMIGGVQVDTRKIRWGVVGEIDRLREENKDDANNERILELLDEVETLRKKLDETIIEIDLRKIPEVILKDARRTARAALDIKGKGIPEDREEEFNARFDAEVLQRVTMRLHDHQSGATKNSISIEEAGHLLNYLPQTEILRLKAKLAELQFGQYIDEAAVSDPDF